MTSWRETGKAGGETGDDLQQRAWAAAVRTQPQYVVRALLDELPVHAHHNLFLYDEDRAIWLKDLEKVRS